MSSSSRPPGGRSQPTIALPRLLTVDEVADALGICARTVRRLIARGELATHRLGRAVRVAEDDYRRLVARSRR
jgi:excisionase family DNA binding protein